MSTICSAICPAKYSAQWQSYCTTNVAAERGALRTTKLPAFRNTIDATIRATIFAAVQSAEHATFGRPDIATILESNRTTVRATESATHQPSL